MAKQNIDAEAKALIIKELLEEKKADNVSLLDVRGVCNFTDFFVFCSARTRRHIKALSEYLEEKLKPRGIHIYRNTRTGGDDDWVVLDCLDVVVHIFDPHLRDFYGVEKLWNSRNKEEA